MAKQKIGINVRNRASIGPAPVIAPAVNALAGAIDDVATASLVERRRMEAEAEVNALEFERDENGMIRPPETREDGAFAPSLFSREYNRMAMIRYREQLSLDSAEQMNRIAREHWTDPEGFASAATAYREATLDAVPESVRGSVDADIRKQEISYQNGINNRVAAREYQRAQETHQAAFTKELEELQAIIAADSTNSEAIALQFERVDNLRLAGAEEQYYGDDTSAVMLDQIESTVARAHWMADIGNRWPDDKLGRAEMADDLVKMMETGEGEILINGKMVPIGDLMPTVEERQQAITPVLTVLKAKDTAEAALENMKIAAQWEDMMANGLAQAFQNIANEEKVTFDMTRMMRQYIDGQMGNGSLDPGMMQQMLTFAGMFQAHNKQLATTTEDAVITQGDIDLIKFKYSQWAPAVQEAVDQAAKLYQASDLMDAAADGGKSLEARFGTLRRLEVFANSLMSNGGSSTQTQRDWERAFARYSDIQEDVAADLNYDPETATREETARYNTLVERTMGTWPVHQNRESAETMERLLTTSGITPDMWFDQDQPIGPMIDQIAKTGILPLSLVDMISSGLRVPEGSLATNTDRALDALWEIQQNPVLFANINKAFDPELANKIKQIPSHLMMSQRRDSTAINRIMESDRNISEEIRHQLEKNPELQKSLDDQMEKMMEERMTTWVGGFPNVNKLQGIRHIGPLVAPSSELINELRELVIGQVAVGGWDIRDENQMKAVIESSMNELMAARGYTLSSTSSEAALADIGDNYKYAWSKFGVEWWFDDIKAATDFYAEGNRIASKIMGRTMVSGENLFYQFMGVDEKDYPIFRMFELTETGEHAPILDEVNDYVDFNASQTIEVEQTKRINHWYELQEEELKRRRFAQEQVTRDRVNPFSTRRVPSGPLPGIR